MIEIGGIQKTTLIDYPGRIAATIFLIGCNFRCPFCYSAELVLPEKIKLQPRISEKEFFDFLGERKGLLEGIVICGGEPTIHKELPDFIKKIKESGFLVKLDTNGSNPRMLRELMDKKLIDYVAMDIKTCREKYDKATGVRVKISDIEESIGMLKEGRTDYEFRTTVVPTVHSKEDILRIAEWIGPAKKYYLQSFRPEKTIDPKFENVKPYPKEFLLEIKKEISKFFDICDVRS
ncbi:MAG: anaerobic ribonucleoside-triphosphate reductase activating protein [Candidatus Pacebacteria bacterium]|nr:anaerobic ribonucleoside-triphosphate reductase activating protein [Candidatus Paceibacterota bacterium]